VSGLDSPVTRGSSDRPT